MFTQAGYWILSQYVIFVLERSVDIDIVAPRFRRLGFDNMCGYLCGGMNEWQEAGKPISSIGVMSVLELKNKLEKKEVELLDVREPNEWKEEGTVVGANKIFFADLPEKADTLPKNKPMLSPVQLATDLA